MISTIFDKGLARSLLKEYKTDNLTTCLVNIGVVDSKDLVYSYEDVTEWQRSGAETYTATAKVSTSHSSEIKFIAKALVSMATQPERQLADWNRRRGILQSLGIATPRLFSAANGVIYEVYIADTFQMSDSLSQRCLEQLGFIAGKLDKGGFNSIAFCRDLRQEDDKLYYVDFGSDLGEPSKLQTCNAWNYLRANLTDSQAKMAISVYKDSLTS